MRFFVTGGAGFIGSNYVRHLLDSDPDAEVTNFDKLTYAGNAASVADLDANPRYRFVQGDICDPAQVAEVLPGHDMIVNFAAETHVDRSIVEPLEAVRTNTLGVATLAEAARLAGAQRFLQVGTDEEYGTIAEGSFSERDRLEPSSPYSAGKAGGSLVALAYATTHKLDVVVTRCTNNYGPYQFPEKVIPLFVTNLLDGQKVPLYGSGGNIRDWLYVLDHCAAIDLVLRRGATGQIYNVGAGNEVTNLELTREILAAFGAGEEMIEFVTDRPGHDWRYSLDSTRIRELGWEPAHDFRAGLAETIDWYRNNEPWWRPLKPRGASRTLDHGRVAGA
ncbi:MAG TPA: dTDP-glucose 4,6-dehydratase [Actinomycetes bacterium]|nr:dTDP-glucose 4,6-dehydratase [Actinomycetes bacterium]